MRRLMLAAVPALVATAIGFAAPAHAMADTIGGTVGCHHGNDDGSKPVGIWVDYRDGQGNEKKGGWATLFPTGVEWPAGVSFDYNGPHVGIKMFHLHIGCGGTPQKWGTTVYIDKPPGEYEWISARW
jgi:hypothetical protein